MRTLTLLAALLLLAFQARAQTLQETADHVPAQDQPGVQDQPELQDQDQPEDDDQDVTVSITGEERLARGAGGLRKFIHCICQHGHCRFPYHPSGLCGRHGHVRNLCCRRAL